VTYPDPAVSAAVSARFVPLRLWHTDARVRELNVLWLPTVFVLDWRGVVHGRSVNALPPAEFLDTLDLGEAHARLKQAGGAPTAARLLEAALGRRPDGPLHPELLFLLGIARYFVGDNDHAGRDEVWAQLLARYPDSIWASRVP
jgi:hypothetical protein